MRRAIPKALESTKFQENTPMLLTSVVRFFSTSRLALAVLAGAVGLAAGGSLAVATIHLTSTTSHTPTASAAGDHGQAQGHGAEVTAAVARCKAALTAGQHGIGKCVSAVANKHGKAASAAASASGKSSTSGADETEPSPEP
jgi:hypothetical protein